MHATGQKVHLLPSQISATIWWKVEKKWDFFSPLMVGTHSVGEKWKFCGQNLLAGRYSRPISETWYHLLGRFLFFFLFLLRSNLPKPTKEKKNQKLANHEHDQSDAWSNLKRSIVCVRKANTRETHRLKKNVLEIFQLNSSNAMETKRFVKKKIKTISCRCTEWREKENKKTTIKGKISIMSTI